MNHFLEQFPKRFEIKKDLNSQTATVIVRPLIRRDNNTNGKFRDCELNKPFSLPNKEYLYTNIGKFNENEIDIL